MRGLVLGFSKKRKTLDQAQKYAQKGQYDKALKEYQKHLQEEPRDTNARLKLGDLHLKRGDQAAAIEAYSQVAEQFSKTGFDAKAVAIYKQVLKIDSSCLQARISLGDHFQRMGLSSDALREFQEAVKTCKERGLKREAFDLLKRVAALDPSNVANRLSLADLLQRENLSEEAEQEYLGLLDEMLRQNDHDSTARVAMRLLESFPKNEKGYISLARAKLALGEAAAPIPALDDAEENLPESVDLREALVPLYEARGDDDAVRRCYRGMADIYKRRGDEDKAREIMQRFVPMQDFSAGDDEFTSPSLLLNEEHADTPSEDAEFAGPNLELGSLSDNDPNEIELIADDTIAPKPSAASKGGAGVDELLAEARVSLEFDDKKSAARVARQILELDPKSKGAKEILREAEKKPAQKPVAKPAAKREKAPAPPPAPDPLEDSLPDIELVLEDETDFDDDLASIEPPTHVELEPLDVDGPGDPLADADVDFEIEIEGGAVAVEEPAAASSASAGTSSSAWVSENLEQAEFFYEQGMLDEAERAFRAVLDRRPNHPQALARLGELEAAQAEPPIAATDFGETTVETDPVDVREEKPTRPTRKKAAAKKPAAKKTAVKAARRAPVIVEEPEDDDPGIDLSAELESELEEAASSFAQEVEPEPLEAEPVADADEGLFDPAELIEPDEPEPEPEGDFDLAALLDEEGMPDGEKSGVGFEEVFRAFKKGIQEQISDDEIDAHYDLAIAYKEMGLLDDAVEQLQLVRRSDEHQVEALGLMATCEIELGRPEDAAGHLSEALALVAEDDESVVALRYELGEALRAGGKNSEALDAYQKAAALNASFRDVQERIEELS